MTGYAILTEVYKDIPMIVESDKENIKLYDDEIKADIDTKIGGFIDLPFSSVPTQITNAATIGVEYLYFLKTNEIDRATALLKRYEGMIAAYIADLQRLRNTNVGKMTVITSGYISEPRASE